jgi:ATPase subunit of ABC transporter with duplicated ATPase domains
VAFAFAGHVPILREVDHRFEPGFTALVGANGAGKTTLLSLIDGALSPDEGEVRVEPDGALIVTCPQVVDTIDDEIVAFSTAWDRRSVRLRAELELDEGELGRWGTLSPGEKKRFQIGAALARRPEVLLLDEPTNHLDARARDLLTSSLRRFRGVGIVVSHDRAFIEELATRTAWLEGGQLRVFDGGYGAAEQVRDLERRARQEARARARAEERRSARALDVRHHKRTAAEKGIGARSRMKSIRDSDGRSLNRKARAAKAEKAHAKAVASLSSRHARDRARLEEARVVKRLGGELFVDYEAARSKRLASLTLPALRAGERVLARGPISLVVERDSRIRVSGDNGSGKTTLLDALLDVLSERSTLHVPQELDAETRRGVVSRVRERPKDARGRILTVLAALGSEPARVLATDEPSPGEAKKLVIAEGLGSGATCVVLDEPTNHLDLPSIERLESALAAYPGALVLVTHDRWFGERLTDQEWRLAGGRLSLA